MSQRVNIIRTTTARKGKTRRFNPLKEECIESEEEEYCPDVCIKNTPALETLPSNYPEGARRRTVARTKALIRDLENSGCDCNDATLEVLNNQLYIYSRGREGWKIIRDPVEKPKTQKTPKRTTECIKPIDTGCDCRVPQKSNCENPIPERIICEPETINTNCGCRKPPSGNCVCGKPKQKFGCKKKPKKPCSCKKPIQKVHKKVNKNAGISCKVGKPVKPNEQTYGCNKCHC